MAAMMAMGAAKLMVGLCWFPRSHEPLHLQLAHLLDFFDDLNWMKSMGTREKSVHFIG